MSMPDPLLLLIKVFFLSFVFLHVGPDFNFFAVQGQLPSFFSIFHDFNKQ